MRVVTNPNNRPIVWIRYNPHTFRIDGNISVIQKREVILVSFVQKVMASLESACIYPPLSMAYMFYNCYRRADGALAIELTQDADFHPTIALCITDIVAGALCTEAENTLDPPNTSNIRAPRTIRRMDLKCRFCDVCVDQLASFRRHEMFNHPKSSSFNCIFTHCVTNHTSEEALRMHLLVVHKIYKCDQCTFLAKQSSTLRTHVLEVHQKLVYRKCDECGQQFSSPEAFLEHVGTHGISTFACELCGHISRRKADIERHRGTVACLKRKAKMGTVEASTSA